MLTEPDRVSHRLHSTDSSSAEPSSAPRSGRSSAASANNKLQIQAFDREALRPNIRASLKVLHGSVWERDQDKVKEWTTKIGQQVKKAALEIGPHGYKYMVSVGIVAREKGGGHAQLTTYWDEGSDTSISETFTNDSLHCSVLAIAVRVLY